MKVKVTENPNWPEGWLLVNNFKDPPYFAYEVVNDDGSKRFVPVLTGGTDEAAAHQHPPLSLTLQRKVKITKFLKTFLEDPAKFGQYMSKEWILELVKFLDLFDEATINATISIVETWLKNPCFKKLIKEIEEKYGCEAATPAATVSGDGAPVPSSSQMAASNK